MARHPYREQAQLLREFAREEMDRAGKWADRDRVAALRSEAAELDRLAQCDEMADAMAYDPERQARTGYALNN
jgi:hypothetical protein